MTSQMQIPKHVISPAHPLLLAIMEGSSKFPEPASPILGHRWILDITYDQMDFASQVTLAGICRTLYAFVWSRARKDAPRLLQEWGKTISPIKDISWNDLRIYGTMLGKILHRQLSADDIRIYFPSLETISHSYQTTQKQLTAVDALRNKHWEIQQQMFAQHCLEGMGPLAEADEMLDEQIANVVPEHRIRLFLRRAFPSGAHALNSTIFPIFRPNEDRIPHTIICHPNH